MHGYFYREGTEPDWRYLGHQSKKPGRQGYKLVCSHQEVNQHIIEDDVLDVAGNGTVLLVRAVTKENCETKLYEISHLDGKEIKSVKLMDAEDYRLIAEQISKNITCSNDINPSNQ